MFGRTSSRPVPLRCHYYANSALKRTRYSAARFMVSRGPRRLALRYVS